MPTVVYLLSMLKCQIINSCNYFLFPLKRRRDVQLNNVDWHYLLGWKPFHYRLTFLTTYTVIFIKWGIKWLGLVQQCLVENQQSISFQNLPMSINFVGMSKTQPFTSSFWSHYPSTYSISHCRLQHLS